MISRLKNVVNHASLTRDNKTDVNRKPRLGSITAITLLGMTGFLIAGLASRNRVTVFSALGRYSSAQPSAGID